MPKKIVEAKVIGQHVLNNSTKLIEVTCRSGAVCKRAGI